MIGISITLLIYIGQCVIKSAVVTLSLIRMANGQVYPAAQSFLSDVNSSSIIIWAHE